MAVLVQTPKLEVLQVYRQEMVNLASGKLGQKDLTRPKSEEDDTNTGALEAVSPEMENMRWYIDVWEELQELLHSQWS